MKIKICPFCSGSKITPYVRNGQNQNCTACNKEGKISLKKLVDMGLELPPLKIKK